MYAYSRTNVLAAYLVVITGYRQDESKSMRVRTLEQKIPVSKTNRYMDTDSTRAVEAFFEKLLADDKDNVFHSTDIFSQVLTAFLSFS